jgi:hypothetical protein
MPIAFAVVRSLTAKRCCISGSPPLNVNPPAITFSPWAYFRSSSTARVTVTGMPLVTVHVSGLWQ